MPEANEITLPQFRITRERYLKIKIDKQEPLDFNIPSLKQVAETFFDAGNFSHLEISGAGKYQQQFVQRAGSLEKAVHYFTIPLYRDLFELLMHNKNDKTKLGKVLKNEERRALHHIELCKQLGKCLPEDLQSYFRKECDELPQEAIELLDKDLLERGFLLRCETCSFEAWYPIDRIGRSFECSRCFTMQVYKTNPIWLYKLPEIIYQGLNQNIEVPLLAVSYLKNKSKHSFEWLPDSNIYLHPNDPMANANTHIRISIYCVYLMANYTSARLRARKTRKTRR